MKQTSSDNPARFGKAWLWKLAISACVSGLGTWLLLSVLIPARPPEELPNLPDLRSQNAELRSLLSGADAQARAHPNSASDIGRLGMIYHANQWYPQAETVYGIASWIDPDDYRWPYCQALLREEIGREREVPELLHRTVRLKPDFIPAVQKLADTYFKRDSLDEAERYCKQSSKLGGSGSSIQALFGLGRVAARRQDWPRVVEYLAPLSREYPQIRPPHQLLLDAYVALGQAEKAEEVRRNLLRPNLIVIPPIKDALSDELLDLCCSSSRLLKQAGYLSRFSNARESLRLARRAVEVEPSDADARYFLSIALLNTQGADPGSVEEALAHLNEGLRIKPDDPQSLQTAADLFFRQKKSESALEQMRAVLARYGRSAENRYYLGVATEQQGKTVEAAFHYREALRINPNLAEPNYRLGLILAGQGRDEQATIYFQKAVDLKPSYARAHYNLGVALERQGKINQAIAHYQEVLRLDPGDFSAHMNLGLLFGRSGKLEDSARLFREAARIRPDDAEARYGLGCALAELHRVEEAAEEFRQALRLRPDYVEARNQLRQLENRTPR